MREGSNFSDYELWWQKKEALLEIRTSLSSLSYTIAALNPAICAFLTFSSNVHPPRTISANGGFGLLPTAFVKWVHASSGSATYKTPHSPDAFIGEAEKIGQHYVKLIIKNHNRSDSK